MRNSNFTVTVSINTFNRPNDLFECLNSLSKQNRKDFDVLIINGGDEGSIDKIVSSFNFPIRVIQQKRKGLVEARNLCWKEAQGEIVCIIDDDLIVSQGWLEEIVKTFLAEKGIGGVTGPTFISKEKAQNRDAIHLIEKFEHGNLSWRLIGKFYLGFIMEGKVRDVGKILECGTFTLGSNFPDSFNKDQLIEVDYLEACHMCFKRKLIAEVGGFDYCYTGTSEWSEPDLAFKIKKLGYRLVFNPKAVAEHRISTQGVYMARTYAYERSANFINFYFRHIKPNTLCKVSHFYSYLLFLNGYWIYKALVSKNINWFSGLLGTFVALSKNILLRPKCSH